MLFSSLDHILNLGHIVKQNMDLFVRYVMTSVLTVVIERNYCYMRAPYQCINLARLLSVLTVN
jgi:hypothetical protein